MQILAFSRRISVLCGVCSPANESGFRVRFGQNLIISFIVTNLTLAFSSYTMYALHELDKGEIAEFLFGSLQVAAVSSTLLSYISIAYQRQNMRKVLDGLQMIFDQCKFHKNSFQFSFYLLKWFQFLIDKHTPSAILYLKTNEFCENLMKWALIIQEGSFLIPALFFLVGGGLFYRIRDGHVETQNLYLPLKTR